MAEIDNRLNTECSCPLGTVHKPTCRYSIAFQPSPRATAERATAGPLTVHKKSTLSGLERSQDWAIVDSDNQIIAECFGISGHKPGTSPKEYLHQPAEANARLFAAAPELRDALFEVHELLFLICHVFCKNNPPPQGFARLERAAAVLAKVLP